MQRHNRRSFLGHIATAALASGTIPVRAGTVRRSDSGRDEIALSIRQNCATFQFSQPSAVQSSNGDETTFADFIGCFSKGLPHDQAGRVDAQAYGTLLHALTTGAHSDFEAIARGSGMKLVDPQAGFAFELEGADPHRFACPPAPSLTTGAAAAEMVELYWHALARDVAFADYGTSPVIAAAARDLSALPGYEGTTPATLFRGPFPGCQDGPFVSQFLWQRIPNLSSWMEQRYRVPTTGNDYLVDPAEWLLLQSGLPPYREPLFDATSRYMFNGRHLAEAVHYDFLYQGFHNAALILLNLGPESILNTNPYYSPTNPYKSSRIQTGFATFGAPHVCSWLGRMTTAALQAAWYQKWCVHRRLRPEEFGGLIQQHLTATARYSISATVLNSDAVTTVYQTNRSYLLPQAYPEGCPLHPAYPAGHATVAGACSVLLKAFFDENGLVTNCVTPDADGTALVPYTGALTVGGEINKLAWNIAIGRNFAGIHYRSDALAGFRLGEDVAIAKLQDLVNILTEDFVGFRFTRLDGTSVEIARQCPALAHDRISFRK
jgi:hypothetical protein